MSSFIVAQLQPAKKYGRVWAGWELGGHGLVNEFGLGLPAIVASFLCWEIQ